MARQVARRDSMEKHRQELGQDLVEYALIAVVIFAAMTLAILFINTVA